MIDYNIRISRIYNGVFKPTGNKRIITYLAAVHLKRFNKTLFINKLLNI